MPTMLILQRGVYLSLTQFSIMKWYTLTLSRMSFTCSIQKENGTMKKLKVYHLIVFGMRENFKIDISNDYREFNHLKI